MAPEDSPAGTGLESGLESGLKTGLESGLKTHSETADPEWAAERAAFDFLGYSAPLPLAEPARAEQVLAAHEDVGFYTKNPHVTSADVRLMLSDPALVDAVRKLCGRDLNLWRSAFFRKTTGTAEIGWHHDKHFFSDAADDIRLDEIQSHYSVFISVTSVTQTTGLLEVLPGTHRDIPDLVRDPRPYHKRPPGEHILKDLPAAVAGRARGVPIPAGCFMIFHSAILHRSLPHTGGGPRLGMAIRLVRYGLGIPPELAEPQDITAFPPIALPPTACPPP